MSSERLSRRNLFVLLALAGVMCAAIAVFMTIGAKGRWDFVLPFRGRKLAALVLVAYAIGVSTVLFQTVAANHILTPSIMGFDAFYVLIQTVLVFTLGAARVSTLDPRLMFLIEVGLMVAFSVALYRWLFARTARSLHLLMLVGVVFGVLFRSLSNFMQRIIDPNEFVVLQDRLFASFNIVDQHLLISSAILVLIASVIGWRMLPKLDVLALGHDIAVNLGVDYRRTVSVVLIVVAILVSVSTALVGPVTFFGLLVANLAYQLVPGGRHVMVLPVAVMLGIIFLVAGQTILERVFSFNSALSIVIEFVGGLVFLFLLVKGVKR